MCSKHWWFSGRILACHAGGPGSIPGQCSMVLFPYLHVLSVEYRVIMRWKCLLYVDEYKSRQIPVSLLLCATKSSVFLSLTILFQPPIWIVLGRPRVCERKLCNVI